MKVFDEAYDRVQNFFQSVINEVATPFCEFVWEFLKDLASLLFAIVIYGTLPIWIIPYKIAKKRRKLKSDFDEALSPQTKQAILDDFMKGSDL